MAESICVRSALSAAAAAVLLTVSSASAQSTEAPLMRDFMGMNVKSWAVTPRITTYAPVLSQFRDYHSVTWDIQAPGDATYFPRGNPSTWIWPLSWQTEYRTWKNSGVRTNMCLQFEGFTASSWNAASAYKYGNDVGNYFGAGKAGDGLIGSIQIGNEVNANSAEPLYYTADQFDMVYRNMAKGVKAATPSTLVVTPNVKVGAGNEYARSVNVLLRRENPADPQSPRLLDYTDVLATHVYPQIVGWPTYEKTYPEDTRSGFTYLQSVRDLISWRDVNAPGKQVWVTEFGYDATLQTPPAGTQYKPVTLTQQARYLVRSYLEFAEMGVDRAYMFYYNDSDSPSVHGAAGLTANYTTLKPSYYAVAHMNSTLRDFRFSAVVTEETGNLFVHEYKHETELDKLIWAVWSPTGSGREVFITLSNLPGEILFAEQMPLADGPAPLVSFTRLGPDQIQFIVGESPVYLHIQVPEPSSLAIAFTGASLLLRRRRRAHQLDA